MCMPCSDREEAVALTEIIGRHGHKGREIVASESKTTGVLTIHLIRVPDDAQRRQGAATIAMCDLVDYADRTNQIIAGTPEPVGEGGPSRAALERWYRRFGFVPNKGRNADESVTAGMGRRPRRGGG